MDPDTSQKEIIPAFSRHSSDNPQNDYYRSQIFEDISNMNDQGYEAHFQPIIRNARIYGCEALLRHKNKPDTPADIIIDDFHQFSKSQDNRLLLDMFMLHQACTMITQTPIDDFYISINLSPESLSSEHLQNITKKIIQKAEIPSHRLKFEIHEDSHDLKKAPTAVQNIMNIRNHMGGQFMLDDFGTGSSNTIRIKVLTHLSRYCDEISKLKEPKDIRKAILSKGSNYKDISPDDVEKFSHYVDSIKLDRSLLDKPEKLIKFSQFLTKLSEGQTPFNIIVEGVENSESYDLIHSLFVNPAIQSFRFGPPMPSEDFKAFSDRHDNRSQKNSNLNQAHKSDYSSVNACHTNQYSEDCQYDYTLDTMA